MSPRRVQKKLEREITKERKRQAKKGRNVRPMFQDEARFSRINNPHNCWAPPDVRPSVPCHMVREYTYAYAAVSPAEGILDSLILPVVNAQAMSLFLSEVSQRHPDDFILMVMDKAGWRQARDLKVPKNMRIIFLPPYSPELNPVEHLWEELHEKHLPNKAFKSLDAVEHALCKGLRELHDDPARVKV